MSEGFICKECNYTSDSAGTCPYCDMPLEPIVVDDVTGEKQEQYDPKEIEVVEKATKDEPEKYEPDTSKKENPIDEDELDEIINIKDEN